MTMADMWAYTIADSAVDQPQRALEGPEHAARQFSLAQRLHKLLICITQQSPGQTATCRPIASSSLPKSSCLSELPDRETKQDSPIMHKGAQLATTVLPPQPVG